MTGLDRDRDTAGRARNARPRDAQGRPLPHGASGVEPLPDDLVLPPDEAIDVAQRLLADGRPFAAHEVFEAVWKAAPAPGRDLWQGLAQIAVGLTHVQRGNPAGAARMLRRGAARLLPVGHAETYGLDLSGITETANDIADRLDAGETVTALPPLTLRR